MKNRNKLSEFSCLQCGACCRWSGSVLLTNEDISLLAEHFKVSEQTFIEEQTVLAPNRIQLALLDKPDGSCRYLKGDFCSVYEVRPVQCSSFPHAWSVSSGCPALDALKEKS